MGNGINEDDDNLEDYPIAKISDAQLKKYILMISSKNMDDHRLKRMHVKRRMIRIRHFFVSKKILSESRNKKLKSALTPVFRSVKYFYKLQW